MNYRGSVSAVGLALRKFIVPSTAQHRYLQIYLICTIFCNLGLLFFNGYEGDLGYWTGWVNQLAKTGYQGFDGNYPPLYIHWLYLVGKFYSYTAIAVENNILLKFLTQIPVLIFHYSLVLIVYKYVKCLGWGSPWFHTLLSLATFSPAIVINGPMWGQVDLVPIVIYVSAILIAFHSRLFILLFPLYILSLLTKFQMIAFLPVVGYLALRRPGWHTLGVLLSLIVVAVLFLPWILIGEFKQAVTQAYIETLGQYPLTTFNAANVWILLTGNTAEDSRQILNLANSGWLFQVGIAKYLGIGLFGFVALLAFIRGVHSSFWRTMEVNQRITEAFFLSTLCALSFFTLLPAMHERYLFPAVIVSMFAAVFNHRYLFLAILISALCAANMAIILAVNGSDIWFGLSLVTVFTCAISVFIALFGGWGKYIVKQAFDTFFSIRHISIWVLFLSAYGVGYLIYSRYVVVNVDLGADERLLTSFPLISARQDHGQLKINRSYDGNNLSVASRRFEFGIGTHANSEIVYELPPNAYEFSFSAGVDDEVGRADIQFIVKGDGVELWRSPVFYGHEYSIFKYSINVVGVNKLELIVDGLKEQSWDHADWINPIVILSNKDSK